MVKAKVWTLKKKFEGKVSLGNFELIEEELPGALEDGGILTQALHWTVDPYMRSGETGLMKEDQCLFGEQISKVIASKNSEYPVGSIVRSFSGWRTHTLFADTRTITSRMPEMGNLPSSLALGVMGMPGMTAYFGFLEICQPKEGETVLINGAAGAVGSVVGQIAKIKGCKVVGSAGTDEKCKWLKDELGFDEAFNYKKVDLDEALTKASPDGFDCYFDNVGTTFTSKAIMHMKQFGRVSICGSISDYSNTEPPQGPYPFGVILFKQLRVEGFNAFRWFTRWSEGEKQMLQWIREGKIKY